LVIVPFDADDAYLTGELWPVTSKKGLSLGDRSCLALGKTLGVRIFTADNNWKGLQTALDVDLVFIRDFASTR
jgi:PIN domain nuclease of toxin-antitoxin system